METKTQYQVRQWCLIHAKIPDLQSLRHWGSCLRGQWRRTFERKHGSLLNIIEVEMQPAAVEALLQREGDWSVVLDDFGLLIYGIILFPHLEDYIDLTVVEVFLAKKKRGENPTMAILANTYYTLNYCCERREGSLRYCMHLLYLWMTAHLFHSKGRTTCPIEDFKWSWVKAMSREF
ncbi:hypothetical protein CR513_14332, partial [Mucuna pruriens]